MISSLLRFIIGSVKIKIKNNAEYFLNAVYKNKIKIFNMSKTDVAELTFTAFKSDYNKLCEIADKTGTQLNLLGTYGLLHVTCGYRKRYGIAVGFVFFAIMLYLSTLFVWDLEIKGNDNISRAEMELMLENSGFAVGRLKSTLDIKKIENRFLMGTDEISWISINLVGTTAYVEVREVEKPPELIDASEPCSIYASRDGIIASVKTYMGYSVVSVGDTVTAGDLIVSGNYTDKYGEQYKLHSYASVMAYTVHSKSVYVPFKTKEHIKTGRSKNKYILKLTRFNIPLYFNKNIVYNNYDKTISEKILRIGKNFKLPFTIVKTTYSEVEIVDSEKDERTAFSDALEKLNDFEYDLVGITVLDRKYSEIIDEHGITVNVMLECYEQIGVTGKLE